jgi:hypothetical protein
MMAKYYILLCLCFFVIGCQDSSIEKPKNLIDKEVMTSILYDMAVLDAVKSQNIGGGISVKGMNEYIYKKYKIDSIQFSESNKYYASDIDGYEKMYQKVKSKIDAESVKLGKINVKPTTPALEEPQIQ